MNHDAEELNVRVDHLDARNPGNDAEKPDAKVRVLDVLDAFAFTPPSPGNAGVFDALGKTGACPIKRLEAMWTAEDQGLLEEIDIQAAYGRHDCCELSAKGLEALKRLRMGNERGGED